MSKYAEELDLAICIAKAAGGHLRDHRDKVRIKDIKEGSHNYTTFQDVESESIIVDAIRKQYPDDSILSEESFGEKCSIERLWIIDPLDGTRNYANGLPFFSVSIAFYHYDAVQVGVVYAPCVNNELFHAVRNEGVFLNNVPVRRVNDQAGLVGSIITTGFAYARGDTLRKAIDVYEKVLNRSTDVVRYGSAALEMCYVAAGRMGGYYESGLKPWDIAAGLLIIEEAGGVCVDFDGNQLPLFRKKGERFEVDILASKNETISLELLEILRSCKRN